MTINPNLIKKVLIGVIALLVLVVAGIFWYFGSVQNPGEQTKQDLNKITENVTTGKLFTEAPSSSSSSQSGDIYGFGIGEDDDGVLYENGQNGNEGSNEISEYGLETEYGFGFLDQNQIKENIQKNTLFQTSIGTVFKMNEEFSEDKIAFDNYDVPLSPVDEIEFNGRIYLYNKEGKIQSLGDQILKIFVTQIDGKEYWVYEEATGMHDSTIQISEPGLKNPFYSQELLDTAEAFENIKDLGGGRFEIEYYMAHDHSEEENKEELHSVKKATINLKKLLETKDKNTKIIE